MPPPQTFNINDLPAFVGGSTAFANTLFEGQVPNGTIASGRRNEKLTGAQIAKELGTNHAIPLFVRFKTLAQQTAAGGPSEGDYLEGIDQDRLCLHLPCTVDIDPSGITTTYTPEFDLTGPLTVYRTGERLPGDTVHASFLEVGAEGTPGPNVRAWDAGITDFGANELITAPIAGDDRFFRVLTAGGPYPTPPAGLSTYYREVAPPIAQQSFFQQLTQLQAIALLDDGQVRRNRLYLIAIGAQMVYVVGMDESTFSGPGQLIDPGNPERTVPVTVNVRSGTIVDIQAILEALAAPVRKTDGGDFIGYEDLDGPIQDSVTDTLVYLNRAHILVSTATPFTDGTLIGGGAVVDVATGQTLTFGNTNSVFDTRFAGSVAIASGLTTASRCEFEQVALLSGGVLAASDSLLEATTFTGVGTLKLRAGTQMSEARIALARAAGLTVIDERTRFAADIEITDPTKGIIMTVGSDRVRARISGTVGARTWTFTEL